MQRTPLRSDVQRNGPSRIEWPTFSVGRLGPFERHRLP